MIVKKELIMIQFPLLFFVLAEHRKSCCTNFNVCVIHVFVSCHFGILFQRATLYIVNCCGLAKIGQRNSR